MTNKVTMPDPFTYVHPNAEKGPLFHAGQMEAYANARVREALEEAIDSVAFYGGPVDLEAAIRTLMPEEAT